MTILCILYVLTLLQQLYNTIVHVEANPFTSIKSFFLENLKLFIFGLLLIIWPTGLAGILSMVCFLIFEAGVYVNYTSQQRKEIAIVFCFLTLNFIPFIVFNNDKPFLQILGKVIGEKVGKEVLTALTEFQEKNPKGFNFLVGTIIAGSITYGSFSVGTGINNMLIDTFYLSEANARHTLLTEQLANLITIKETCSPEFLPANIDQNIITVSQEKQTWAEIKYEWEIKKWP